MNYTQIGKTIRKYRKEMGFTQEELADKINVTWEMISRYERGQSSPLNKIDLLAKHLSTTPLQLIASAYEMNAVSDTRTNQIPIFEGIPLRETGSTYTAPDWVISIDPETYAFKTEGVLYYISPNSKPTRDDLILSEDNKIMEFTDGTNYQGIVLAKEIRYK